MEQQAVGKGRPSPLLSPSLAHLAAIQIDETLRFVRHERPEVFPDDAMPLGAVFFIELLLDERRYVLKGRDRTR